MTREALLWRSQVAFHCNHCLLGQKDVKKLPGRICIQSWSWQPFPAKVRIVNTWSFWGHLASVTATLSLQPKPQRTQMWVFAAFSCVSALAEASSSHLGCWQKSPVREVLNLPGSVRCSQGWGATVRGPEEASRMK
jgi:hypothetical protein